MTSFIVSSFQCSVSPPHPDSHNGNDLPSASAAASASRAATPSPSPTAAKALPAGGSALARAARRATTAIDTLESAPASSRTTKLACAGTIAGSSATQTAALTAHTLTGTIGDTGAIGSPLAARALRSWNFTGAPANSASKNVSSPVSCGAIASGRCTDVKSAAGRTAASGSYRPGGYRSTGTN